jgi:hypothetical protein
MKAKPEDAGVLIFNAFISLFRSQNEGLHEADAPKAKGTNVRRILNYGESS